MKGINRKRADADGLWIYLCADCHRGTYGVHGKHGHDKDMALKRAGEYKWLTYFDRTIEEWIAAYGRNYLDFDREEETETVI